MLACFKLPLVSYAVWPLLLWCLGAFAAANIIGLYYEFDSIVGFFSLSFMLATWYLLCGSLALAARALFQHIANGIAEQPLPKFSLNPFESLFAFTFALLAAVNIVTWDSHPLIYASVSGVLVPGFTVMLLLYDPPSSGFTAQAINHVFKGLGLLLVAVFALVFCAHLGLAYVLIEAPTFLGVAGVGYAYLVCHSIIGWVVYTQRHRIEVETLDSPEQRIERLAQARADALDTLLVELHRLCTVGNIRDAAAKLEAHVQQDPSELDPITHERLKSFSHESLLLEHAVRYLDRLTAADLDLRAWVLLSECVARDPLFRHPDDAVMYAALTGAQQEHVLELLPLLEDFESSYHESIYVPLAKLHHAYVLLEWTSRRQEGLDLLHRIERHNPEMQADEMFRFLLTKHA